MTLVEDLTPPTVYARLFEARVTSGDSPIDAAAHVADIYLDGKPRSRGKRKLTRTERDTAFWASAFLSSLPAETWRTESLILALTRYMGQTRVGNLVLIEHLAFCAPESIKRAIRHSGLVLQPRSPRRAEVAHLAAIMPEAFGDVVRILDLFAKAYQERLADVDARQRPLATLSPLEFLTYASLFAFENWVPRDILSTSEPEDPDLRTEAIWDAISDLLIGKLKAADRRALRLTERDVAKSVAQHLSPFLLPSASGSKPREDLYRGFEELLSAQIELNSFVSRAAHAFSFDDDIEFADQDEGLILIERDLSEKSTWDRDGDRLLRLHYYWLYRGMEQFAASDFATATIGRPENHEANLSAYVSATRTYLRLTEVYGLANSVRTESGLRVDLFQALLSLELMTVFFQEHFISPYMQFLKETGNTRLALCRLALDGRLGLGMQNRFPITWSNRAAKIANITGWTVTEEFPHGRTKAAEAILDFWTVDCANLAVRLRKGEAGLHPTLHERPILKMGQCLFQLPWVVAFQNNASAAINNLRRLGARRVQAREETRRIEAQLAKLFEHRGFAVVLNYQPQRTAEYDPGEVDLICARDGHILVLEIKSTFIRRSPKDAWIHGTTTLRKAGLQLSRKVEAVAKALIFETGLTSSLGFEPNIPPPPVLGWIVDTSIEHDHKRFRDYLKVSLEEMIIALRDDRHLLNDPAGLVSGATGITTDFHLSDTQRTQTLYPTGFSASRFIEVIESEAVWDEPS